MIAALIGLIILPACAARTRHAPQSCAIPPTLHRAMSQQDVLATLGAPQIHGIDTVLSERDQRGVAVLSVAVSHGVPLDAPDVTWLYVGDHDGLERADTWMFLRFRKHQLAESGCARLARHPRS